MSYNVNATPNAEEKALKIVFPTLLLALATVAGVLIICMMPVNSFGLSLAIGFPMVRNSPPGNGGIASTLLVDLSATTALAILTAFRA